MSECSGWAWGTPPSRCLEDLKAVDPVRHGEAVVRSAEFFNCNPNLAGLALGATARAEYEALPGRSDRAASHRTLQSAWRHGRRALLGRTGAGTCGRRAGRCSAGCGMVGHRRFHSHLQRYSPVDQLLVASDRDGVGHARRGSYRDFLASEGHRAGWPSRRLRGWRCHPCGRSVVFEAIRLLSRHRGGRGGNGWHRPHAVVRTLPDNGPLCSRGHDLPPGSTEGGM